MFGGTAMEGWAGPPAGKGCRGFAAGTDTAARMGWTDAREMDGGGTGAGWVSRRKGLEAEDREGRDGAVDAEASPGRLAGIESVVGTWVDGTGMGFA